MRLRNLLRLSVLLIVLLFIMSGCGTSFGAPSQTEALNLHICQEDYAVLLSTPFQHQVYKVSDPAPTFSWQIMAGLPERFTVEIDYLGGEPYITGTAVGSISYILPDEDWETIKNNPPEINGARKIRWRVKMDYTCCDEKETYYSHWCEFEIDMSS